MKASNLLQVIIFIIILVMYYAVDFFELLSGLELFIAVIGGVLMHYWITNKGNKAIVNIKPFSGGFRVLIYDILF
ncbi:hypothetical protein E3E37_10920, partial [Thermococcus sp. ES12]|nr:hypothetical protein [Thermococcus sp. ES12]